MNNQRRKLIIQIMKNNYKNTNNNKNHNNKVLKHKKCNKFRKYKINSMSQELNRNKKTNKKINKNAK